MDGRPSSATESTGDPSLLHRRVSAGLVDLTTMAVMTAGAAVATSTRVTAIRGPDGSVSFASTDQAALSEMTGPLSRGHLLGDTLWAFSTTAVLLVTAAAVLSGIIVGVVIPGLAGGRSPGKIIFRLCVVRADGGSAGMVRHLVRTIASLADLMPLVVPGLTGYAFAVSNPNHQRIGDRLARTVVVDRNLNRAVLNRSAEPSDLTDDGQNGAPRPAVRNRAPSDSRDNSTAEPPPHGDTVDMTDRGNTSDATTSAEVDAVLARIPVEERSNNPYPKPVRRVRDEADETRHPDFDSLTLPESSLSDMPLTNTALFEALGLAPDGSDDRESVTEPAVEEPATTGPLAGETADKRAPIWSEDWDAWIYWDTSLRGWFRYDEDEGAWVPMDED